MMKSTNIVHNTKIFCLLLLILIISFTPLKAMAYRNNHSYSSNDVLFFDPDDDFDPKTDTSTVFSDNLDGPDPSPNPGPGPNPNPGPGPSPNPNGGAVSPITGYNWDNGRYAPGECSSHNWNICGSGENMPNHGTFWGYQQYTSDGIDIGCAAGTPVYAANDGVVGWVKNVGSNIENMTVEDGDSLSSLYAHVRHMVDEGDVVTAGQQIAVCADLGGNSHLHFELKDNTISPSGIRAGDMPAYF